MTPQDIEKLIKDLLKEPDRVVVHEDGPFTVEFLYKVDPLDTKFTVAMTFNVELRAVDSKWDVTVSQSLALPTRGWQGHLQAFNRAREFGAVFCDRIRAENLYLGENPKKLKVYAGSVFVRGKDHAAVVATTSKKEAMGLLRISPAEWRHAWSETSNVNAIEMALKHPGVVLVNTAPRFSSAPIWTPRTRA